MKRNNRRRLGGFRPPQKTQLSLSSASSSTFSPIINSTPVDAINFGPLETEDLRPLTQKSKMTQKHSSEIGKLSQLSRQSQKKKSLFKSSTTNNELIDKNSLFYQLITESGFNFTQGDESNELMVESALFKKRLYAKLTENLDKNKQIFGSHLEQLSQNDAVLRNILSCTLLRLDSESQELSSRESLIELLLQIDPLQHILFRILLSKLKDISQKKSLTNYDEDIFQMILQQIRFLPLTDKKAVIDDIFNILEQVPSSIKPLVITSIPEILSDCEADEIVGKLCPLLDSHPNLFHFIIQALNQIGLKQKVLHRVTKLTIKKINEVNFDKLPEIINFLVSIDNPLILKDVVEAFRTELAFSDPKNQTKSDKIDLMIQCVQIIQTALCLNNALIEEVLNQITNGTDENESKLAPFDLSLLLLLRNPLHSSLKDNIQLKVRQIIRQAIVDERLDNDYITGAFKSYGPIFSHSSDQAISLFFGLLEDNQPEVYRMSGIFIKIFILNTKPSASHAAVFKLVNNLGNLKIELANRSLSILNQCADENLDRLHESMIVFLALLDRISELDNSILCSCMDFLCRIAFTKQAPSGELLRTDIQLMIRKYINDINLNLQKRGVLLAVMMLKNVASQLDPSEINDQEQENPEYLKPGKQILDLITRVTPRTPDTLGLFFDAFADALHRTQVALDARVIGQCWEYLLQKFTLSFMASDDEPIDGLATEFLLDHDLSNPFVLRTYECARQDKLRSNPNTPLRLLPALLRALKMSTLAMTGKLVDIDGLLGCAVTITPPSLPRRSSSNQTTYPAIDEDLYIETHLKKSPEEQHLDIDVLFYIINFFREIINCFVYQKSSEIQNKVHQRLEQISALSRLLSKVLAYNPDYKPPRCLFLSDPRPPPLTNAVTSKRKRKNKGGTNKKKKIKKEPKNQEPPGSDSEIIDIASGEDEEAEKETTSIDSHEITEIPSQNRPPVNLDLYADYFRELDSDCSLILNRKLNIDGISQVSSQSSKAPLSLYAFEILISDFASKLELKLVPALYMPWLGKRPILACNAHLNLAEPAHLARRAAALSKYLVGHLNDLGDRLANFSNNDSMIDDPRDQKLNLIKINHCLCIRALAATIRWPDFRYPQFGPLLKELLKHLTHITLTEEVEPLKPSRLETSTFKCTELESDEDIFEEENENMSDVAVEKAIKRLALIAMKKISLLYASCLYLEPASQLVSLLEGISKCFEKSTKTSSKAILVRICERLLKMHFLPSDDLSLFPNPQNAAVQRRRDIERVDRILTIYFKALPTNKLRNRIAQWITDLSRILLDDKNALPDPESRLEFIPAITKNLVPIFYGCLMRTLYTDTVSYLDNDANRNLNKFSVIKEMVKLLRLISNVLKKEENRRFLDIYFKQIEGFLRLYVDKCFPVFDKIFLNHGTEIMNVIREMRKVTIFLNAVCIDIKQAKTAALGRRVPGVMSQLSAVLDSVHKLFTKYQCGEELTVCQLRPFNILGEKVDELSLPALSQSSRGTEVDNTGESEEHESLSDIC